jgi:Tol biopolymer transport system component
LIETGNTSLDVLDAGHRTPIACVINTPQYFGHPAFSPDGQKVAFVLSTSPTSGQQDWGDDVYTANANGAGVKLVLKRDAPGAMITSLVWTPDGDALLFGYFRAVYGETGSVSSVIYQVRRLDLAGGSVSTLVDNASQASISWDGKQIVYVTYPTSDFNVTEIGVAGIDGSDPHTILANLSGFQSYFEPHLSPDGKRLVFAAVGGPVSRAPARPLTRSPSEDNLIARLARPGMSLIEPAPAAADGSPYEVWVVNLDGSGLHTVANLREDVPYPLWSADGKQILFLGAAALYLAQADGSGVKQIDRGIAHGQMDWYQGPAG